MGQAFMITFIGMGGVFVILTLLIVCMELLRLSVPVTSNTSKIAAVLAIAYRQKNGGHQ